MSTGLLPYVDLYIDIVSQPGRLVSPAGANASTMLDGLVQGSHLPLRIFPVRPTGMITSSAYAEAAIGGFGNVKIAVGPRAGSASPYALAGSGSSYPFSPVSDPDSDGKKNYWTGDLNLNTSEMNSAIGTAESITAWLEISVSVGGNYRVILQKKVTIYAAVIDPTGAISVPTAATEYYTKAELDALVVFWDNRSKAANAGKTILLTSPSGGAVREIGIADNGTPTDNLSV